jgi:hypothetical protein
MNSHDADLHFSNKNWNTSRTSAFREWKGPSSFSPPSRDCLALDWELFREEDLHRFRGLANYFAPRTLIRDPFFRTTKVVLFTPFPNAILGCLIVWFPSETSSLSDQFGIGWKTAF